MHGSLLLFTLTEIWGLCYFKWYVLLAFIWRTELRTYRQHFGMVFCKFLPVFHRVMFVNCCQKFVLEIECKVFVNVINLSRKREGGSNSKISYILLKNYPALYTKIFTVKWELRKNSWYHLYIWQMKANYTLGLHKNRNIYFSISFFTMR